MFTSDGNGGYCDCGDNEAFLKDSICAKHATLAHNMPKQSANESLEKYPADVVSRTKELMREICKYVLYVTCHRKRFNELLVGQKEKEIWKDLQFCFQFSNYSLILMNDDTHTVDDVMTVIRNSMDVSPKEAQDLTEVVDKEGRVVLVVGTYRVFQQMCPTKTGV